MTEKQSAVLRGAGRGSLGRLDPHLRAVVDRERDEIGAGGRVDPGRCRHPAGELLHRLSSRLAEPVAVSGELHPHRQLPRLGDPRPGDSQGRERPDLEEGGDQEDGRQGHLGDDQAGMQTARSAPAAESRRAPGSARGPGGGPGQPARSRR